MQKYSMRLGICFYRNILKKIGTLHSNKEKYLKTELPTFLNFSFDINFCSVKNTK